MITVHVYVSWPAWLMFGAMKDGSFGGEAPRESKELGGPPGPPMSDVAITSTLGAAPLKSWSLFCKFGVESRVFR